MRFTKYNDFKIGKRHEYLLVVTILRQQTLILCCGSLSKCRPLRLPPFTNRSITLFASGEQSKSLSAWTAETLQK